MSKIKLMHAKLHRVRVTEANIEYVGSITIDKYLIDKVGIMPLEEVNIWNVTNGNRLSTYVLPGKPGSGEICANGAAARLCDEGDILIIVAYEERDREEVLRSGHGARVILADEDNGVGDFIRQQLIPSGDTVQLHTLSNKVGLE